MSASSVFQPANPDSKKRYFTSAFCVYSINREDQEYDLANELLEETVKEIILIKKMNWLKLQCWSEDNFEQKSVKKLR